MPTTIHSLPPEVHLEILSQLSPSPKSSLLSCALVCQYWHLPALESLYSSLLITSPEHATKLIQSGGLGKFRTESLAVVGGGAGKELQWTQVMGEVMDRVSEGLKDLTIARVEGVEETLFERVGFSSLKTLRLSCSFTALLGSSLTLKQKLPTLSLSLLALNLSPSTSTNAALSHLASLMPSSSSSKLHLVLGGNNNAVLPSLEHIAPSLDRLSVYGTALEPKALDGFLKSDTVEEIALFNITGQNLERVLRSIGGSAEGGGGGEDKKLKSLRVDIDGDRIGCKVVGMLRQLVWTMKTVSDAKKKRGLERLQLWDVQGLDCVEDGNSFRDGLKRRGVVLEEVNDNGRW